MWNNVSDEGKDIISKLLIKNRKQRITITEVLEHPWILGNDEKITRMRRKSQDMQDKVLQFVAFSNTNMEQIEKNSPRSATSGKFNFEEKKESREPKIASLSEASSKPGAFAAMLQKKKD